MAKITYRDMTTALISSAAQLPEDLHPPACHGGEQPGPQVSGGVKRVAAVQSHRNADGHDDQANGQRLHTFGSSNVSPIDDSQDTQDQHTCPHHLHEKDDDHKKKNLFHLASLAFTASQLSLTLL